ncbi:MAG TPA: peptide-methionine (R)-S-oxide reductase MsrB [Pyrinomonadaceae bacterium]|nr:peptide-methionine (R)-S-oxide reductase MsrB [Pyrinomonadaceae bacterium]
MNRRYFLSSAIAVGAVGVLSRTRLISALSFADDKTKSGNSKTKSGSEYSLSKQGVKKVTKTKEEWKQVLTPEQYSVTREKGTEMPFSSPLNEIHDQGIFECVACGLPLFSSQAKFDSGTGWPSFYQPIASENVHEETDKSLWETRTEVLCARCDSHLGHVFDDGPKPTGLRYCMNGVALKFVKDA